MQYFPLRRWLLGISLIGASLLAIGCIKVADGPHAEATISCPSGVSTTLTPADPCVTVASSKTSSCDLVLSLDCDLRVVGPQTIKPGTQTTLCCPPDTRLSRINITCIGEEGMKGQCKYYIVNHGPDAPKKTVWFY